MVRDMVRVYNKIQMVQYMRDIGMRINQMVKVMSSTLSLTMVSDLLREMKNGKLPILI